VSAGEPQAPCPRCADELMRALTPERIGGMAAGLPIPASLRTGQPTLEMRLAVCGDCEALHETVLCAYCGCFVLFRARVQEQSCPHPRGNKWLFPVEAR
jgi:hypothetical protein